MRIICAVPVISILVAPVVWAQFDLLTPQEASRIVKQVPPIVEVAKEQRCRTLTEVRGDPQRLTALDVDVRCGSFHDRYVVNRRSGTVTTWGDSPSAVGGQESGVLAEQIVMQARTRILSLSESRCLTVEAARSLPGWGDPAHSITIQTLGPEPFSPETLFQLRLKSLAPQTEDAVLLYVDPRTGYVRNAGGGAELMSASLGGLLAKLIALRSPPLLSDQDALSIALKVPDLTEIAQRKNCSLIASSALTPEEAQIAPGCDGHYLDGPRVAINLRDGTVSDADTGKPIVAPEAVQLAQTLLSKARNARMLLQEGVDAECSGASRP
jgi:hypothetical protein